MVTLLATLSDL